MCMDVRNGTVLSLVCQIGKPACQASGFSVEMLSLPAFIAVYLAAVLSAALRGIAEKDGGGVSMLYSYSGSMALETYPVYSVESL